MSAVLYFLGKVIRKNKTLFPPGSEAEFSVVCWRLVEGLCKPSGTSCTSWFMTLILHLQSLQQWKHFLVCPISLTRLLPPSPSIYTHGITLDSLITRGTLPLWKLITLILPAKFSLSCTLTYSQITRIRVGWHLGAYHSRMSVKWSMETSYVLSGK